MTKYQTLFVLNIVYIETVCYHVNYINRIELNSISTYRIMIKKIMFVNKFECSYNINN